MSAAVIAANAAITSVNAAMMTNRNGGLGLNIDEITRGFALVCLILFVLYILECIFECRNNEEMYKNQVHKEKVKKSNKILEERALRLKEKFRNFNKNF